MNLQKLKDRRSDALDRRLAAVHEAGHIVIARHLGLQASGEIWRTPKAGDQIRKWEGRVDISEETPDDQDQSFKIAVAGDVATSVWQREWPLDLSDLLSRLGTDLFAFSSIGQSAQDQEIAAAAKFVAGLVDRGGPCWDDLIRTSRSLIVRARQMNKGSL